MNESTSTPQLTLPCQNLRSKEMFHSEPGAEDDAYSSGIYWCLKTHEGFGPDGQPTGRKACCAGRSCFVG
jgi:hypothetical protein